MWKGPSASTSKKILRIKKIQTFFQLPRGGWGCVKFELVYCNAPWIQVINCLSPTGPICDFFSIFYDWNYLKQTIQDSTQFWFFFLILFRVKIQFTNNPTQSLKEADRYRSYSITKINWDFVLMSYLFNLNIQLYIYTLYVIRTTQPTGSTNYKYLINTHCK